MKKYFNLILILFISSLIIQGFQCASREMTTAKVAVQNKDYPKAVEFFQLELQKNPNNTEALIALTETYIMMEDVEGANRTFTLLRQKDSIRSVKERIPVLRNQIWTKAYNDGFVSYQRYMQSGDLQHGQKGLEMLDIGITHMPRIVDFYILKASIYEKMGQEDKAKER